ncbi:TetR/AcrR family transcriptional regulator [Streptomyces antimicrobicus]|uniref:TetR/AcrR family transcriptional regulator C-terminal domain-containing protein n=1 Tax=Streptomyces antimicrobicus TaxID=2883108 RepID=A0ABS8BCJ1_9ACTN|nr:TetR/AcrR family transcriptional regulator C-terminal domain-containing protein [Streptomyces antimicrobicus]MCB5182317.1 TetR/AcrR family transcriptional regulator C-terminal domain-containing protein [Streptomyces antimicrobicus]
MADDTKPQPIPSVWARRTRQNEQPALSQDAIVREAVVMLDAEGIEALSMRKLAARLNAGATSLYRHVATKDELMELAVDEVFAEVAVPPVGSADWRTAAAEAAASFRATALRHPWLSSVLGQAGLAYLGPNLMSFSNRLAALFVEAGFREPARAIDALFAYVVGMSSTETAWLTTVARSGETEAQFIARLMPAAQQAAQAHENLAEAYAAATTEALDPAAVRDSKFAYGLEAMLDGLALRLPGGPATSGQ